MARPIVALLSDFGSRDHYIGAMKGVILGICPDATLVDISHDVPAHDVLTAGFELAAAYRYFPSGTVFLVVVDPGVGSARRGLAADTGEYRFVAPDNGVLTAVLQETPPKRVVELTERRYARPTVSRTFEGRDRFAPAAAWIAKGIQLSGLGRPADHQMLDLPLPEYQDDRIVGQVQRVESLWQPGLEYRSENVRAAVTKWQYSDRGRLACDRSPRRDIRRHRHGRGVRAVREHRPPGVCGQLGKRGRATQRRAWRACCRQPGVTTDRRLALTDDFVRPTTHLTVDRRQWTDDCLQTTNDCRLALTDDFARPTAHLTVDRRQWTNDCLQTTVDGRLIDD